MPRCLRMCAALLAAAGGAVSAAAELCVQWSAPQILGQLDIRMFPEASGIAVASNGEWLYHINDGREANFLITRRDGSAARRIEVSGFDPADVEDLAVGPCGQRTCLYLADVGDNAVRREFVQIAVIEEQQRFDDKVAPRNIIRARYPDGAHNAEAIALHPSGDLFLVTKSGSGIGQSGPAKVFRLRARQLAAGGEQLFEARGEIPVPTLGDAGIGRPRVVTAMDIASDGSRFVLLTYDSIIEIALDLAGALPAPSAWVAGRTHRAQPVTALLQAEAIAYDRDGRSLLYSTESVLGSAAPVVSQRCTD